MLSGAACTVGGESILWAVGGAGIGNMNMCDRRCGHIWDLAGIEGGQLVEAAPNSYRPERQALMRTRVRSTWPVRWPPGRMQGSCWTWGTGRPWAPAEGAKQEAHTAFERDVTQHPIASHSDAHREHCVDVARVPLQGLHHGRRGIIICTSNRGDVHKGGIRRDMGSGAPHGVHGCMRLLHGFLYAPGRFSQRPCDTAVTVPSRRLKG